MKVSASRLNEAIRVLVSMGAKRVILFGSMLDDPEGAHDLDLAVEGIPLRRVLDADLAVHEICGIPTDLISREENPDFFSIIQDYGRVLHSDCSGDQDGGYCRQVSTLRAKRASNT